MYRFGSLLLVVSLVAACGQQAQETSDETVAPTVSTEADAAAIEAVRDQEVADYMSGDATLGSMADNAVIMPPNEPGVVGIEAARAWATGFFDQFTFDALDYTYSDIVVAGDWAIERYAGTATFVPTAGGDPLSEPFKGIHVYRRQADGEWKIAQDIWNFDTAPAAE